MSTKVNRHQKKSLSRRQRIAGRLAGYAVAGGAMVVAGTQAQGAIVYQSLNDVLTCPDGVPSTTFTFGVPSHQFSITDSRGLGSQHFSTLNHTSHTGGNPYAFGVAVHAVNLRRRETRWSISWGSRRAPRSSPPAPTNGSRMGVSQAGSGFLRVPVPWSTRRSQFVQPYARGREQVLGLEVQIGRRVPLWLVANDG